MSMLEPWGSWSLMASNQEVMGLELKRITQDMHCMNSTSKPFASLDGNTCDDIHAELHKSSIMENRSLLFSNKRDVDDGLVKTTIMWKPVGDIVKEKEKPNELGSFVTEGVTQQSHKPFTTTIMHKKATYGEKENLESGSCWARGQFDFSKVDMKQSDMNINAGLSCLTAWKSLQEGFEISSKPVTRLEIKVVDEAVGGLGPSIFDGKPMNECKVIVHKVPGSHSKAILEKTEVSYSQKRQSASNSPIQTSNIESREGTQPSIALVQEKMKGDLCSGKNILLNQCHNQSHKKSSNLRHNPEVTNPCLLSRLESPTQNFEQEICDEWRHCPTTTKTPLYGQFRAQNIGEHCCGLMTPELLKTSVHPEPNSRSVQVAQNNDHFVVLFSAQKTKKGTAGRLIRQDLLKLSRTCTQHSRKILSWIISLARGKNIKGCLRCLWQNLASQPRGFMEVKSQPEFSRNNMSSTSSNRKLANDKELKAVLMKINEVLVSMERTSPEGANLRSSEGVERV